MSRTGGLSAFSETVIASGCPVSAQRLARDARSTASALDIAAGAIYLLYGCPGRYYRSQLQAAPISAFFSDGCRSRASCFNGVPRCKMRGIGDLFDHPSSPVSSPLRRGEGEETPEAGLRGYHLDERRT